MKLHRQMTCTYAMLTVYYWYVLTFKVPQHSGTVQQVINIHIVNLWSCKHQVTLKNEITQMTLLTIFNLKDGIADIIV